MKLLTCGAISVAAFFSGCNGITNQRQLVIAANSTVIGLEIAQNPATQIPVGKLGYVRSELALVPSNRSALQHPAQYTDSKNNSKNAKNITSDFALVGKGAVDVPDVLMELKFSGIFSRNTGIYQRLAVGENAVNSVGAMIAFIRNEDGTIDQDTINAVNNLKAISKDELNTPLKNNEIKVDQDTVNRLIENLEKISKQSSGNN